MNNTSQQTITRVFELLPRYVAHYNLSDALAVKENGDWRTYSAQEFIDNANALSLGLLKIGLGKNDKVAVISSNRPEWNFVDFGTQQIGGVLVPMYPTITVEEYRFIFQDASVKVIFVEGKSLYDKVQEAIKGIEGIEAVYTFDEVAGAKHWSEILDLAKGSDIATLEPYKAAVSGEDLLTLIYTSGTTGLPKGVMLTHHNIISNVESVLNALPLVGGERALSFLPLCHIYERTVLYFYMRRKVSVYYAESMETIADNLKEIKPHIFTTVPRLLEKVYDKIVAKGHELTGVKKQLFFWALNLGLQYDPAHDMGAWYNIQLSIARKLIFSKWKEALGGNIKFICSGAAALQPRLARVFWAAGIPVSEGYGLTETSPVITVNQVSPPDLEIGTVGKIINGVSVKIAEDGEILVKGPNIMKGYYNRPEQTAEVIDADGWFHTGDIGEMVQGKFLKITDRKKEIFKTSGGKYIAPQAVENKLKESFLIDQAVVVGEGQKFPSALIGINFDALRKHCEHDGIIYTTDADMVKHPQIIAKIEHEIEKVNEHIAQYERVKKFRLLPQLLSIDGGELTPTLKLKRKVINANHKNLIESMYE